MEKKEIKELVKPNLVTIDPTGPGLYLYVRNRRRNESYPPVDLVAVREQTGENGEKYLIADSDSWISYFAVEDVKREYPGKWSSKIYFNCCQNRFNNNELFW
jgi:hypothetical protein